MGSGCLYFETHQAWWPEVSETSNVQGADEEDLESGRKEIPHSILCPKPDRSHPHVLSHRLPAESRKLDITGDAVSLILSVNHALGFIFVCPASVFSST